MTIIHAVFYGIIQGLSEFLPVSSSGHLALLPVWFNFKDPGVEFDLMMHVGTAFAVLLYFYKDFLINLKSLPRVFTKDDTADVWLTRNLLIAFIFSTVFILILKKPSEMFGRSVGIISINLALFGLLLWFSDRKKDVETVFFQKPFWKKAIVVGISQAIAIFPGVSRSGITITAARMVGIGREEAARFSFLLSLPIILAATCLKVLEIYKADAVEFNWILCLVGMFISFVVGLVTIHFFLKFIVRLGFFPFAIYRVLLAVVLYLQFMN